MKTKKVICEESKCNNCEWLLDDIDGIHVCPAFPDGIPEKYLSGKKIHSKVDDDQMSHFTYTPKPPVK